MKPVEIMALLAACAVIIKLVVALISPRAWLDNITRRTWTHPILTTLLSMVLAVATLVFLLKELTIVQIFASLLFLTPLIVLGFVPFAGELLELEKLLELENKILRDRNALKKAWLASLIWLILAAWVLYALFV